MHTTANEIKLYQSQDYDITDETPEYFKLKRNRATFIGHVLNVLRKHSIVAALGFNVLSMMRQPLSTFIGVAFGTIIGLNYDGTIVPMVEGFLLYGGISLCLIFLGFL